MEKTLKLSKKTSSKKRVLIVVFDTDMKPKYVSKIVEENINELIRNK